jgi:hypothetical protein
VKHITRVLLVCAIVVTLISVAEVRPAAAARCFVASGSNPPLITGLTFNLTLGHRYTIVSTIFGTITLPPVLITGSTVFPIFPGDTITVYDEDGSCTGGTNAFVDGRENAYDAAQTVAVYCDVPRPGDLRVYAIFDNVGKMWARLPLR